MMVPFLENVLRGRNVPRGRLLAVAEHYHQFGGKSPINQQMRDLMWFDAAGLVPAICSGSTSSCDDSWFTSSLSLTVRITSIRAGPDPAPWA
jgi:hypothetical protein